jgi:hypothetical protein
MFFHMERCMKAIQMKETQQFKGSISPTPKKCEEK